MIKKLLLTSLLSFIGCLTFATEMVSTNLVKTCTIEDLQKWYHEHKIPKPFAKVKYAVDVYKIIYKTPYVNGEMVKASGVLLVPKGYKGKLALISYQHGTESRKSESPSNLKGEFNVGWGLAADGYAVCMPDYVGLGEGDGLHLYIHSSTEASATIDLIRSVREFTKNNNIALNDQLFLVGYSQGGHATMATHKMMEELYPNEFKVTACAPLSGPYDVSGVQMTIVTQEKPYSDPGYLPYVIFSYNKVYHLFNEPSEVMIHPYDSTLPPLFNGLHGMGALNSATDKIPAHILKPEVLATVQHDSTSKFVAAMRDNDTYRWVPKAPMRMCYCEADEQVYYRNAIVANDYFKSHGAKYTVAKSMGKHFDHGRCAIYALLTTKMWFDSFKNGSVHGRKGPLGKRFLLALSKPAVRKRK